MNEEPIATYVEKNIERTGQYCLYADRLDISVRYFLRGRFEASVPLSTFTGSTSLVRVHSSVFNLSLCVLLAAVLLLIGVSFVPNGSEVPTFGIVARWLFLLAASTSLITARRLTLITLYGCLSIPIGKGPSGLPGLQAFVARVLAARC